MYSDTSSLDIDPRLAIEKDVTEQKMHSPLTGPIAGCTGTVSLPIRALSGEYVLLHGTPQSSLSLVMCERCIIVVGRLLGELLVVGRLAVDVDGRLLSEVVVGRLAVQSPLTGTIAGCTGTVSLPIRALSGEYVLLHGTPQSSLSLVMCEHCIIVVGRLLGESLVGRLAVDVDGRLLSEVVVGRLAVQSPLTGTIAGCTGTVSLPIRALSGEYVLLHGTPQLSLSLVMWEHCIVVGRLLGELLVGLLSNFLGFRRIVRSLVKNK
jgi:hypothetical protein